MKADFTTIYAQPDPRAYFGTLRPLEYQVPQHAKPVIETALEASGGRTVLDVCCSYGINAALLRLDVDLETLGAHAADPARADLDPESVIAADAEFHAAHLRRPDVRVLGLDASAPAIDYGVRTGLLAAGWAEDLESADPSPSLVAGVADVGLVVCTGGVGYVGRETFTRILAAVAKPEELWLAVFVLRVFDYAEIATVFEPYGLVTEKLPGTYPQRRFADEDEQAAAITDVEARGVDATGREAAGWYHADCWLTRPASPSTPAPPTTCSAAAIPRSRTGALDLLPDTTAHGTCPGGRSWQCSRNRVDRRPNSCCTARDAAVSGMPGGGGGRGRACRAGTGPPTARCRRRRRRAPC